MSAIEMRDVSFAGHELGRARVEGLPAVIALGGLLEARIRSDVARYNVEPGPVFAGLVQPADAVRHRDGHHLRTPRPLDAEHLLAAAREAVAAGLLWFVVDDEERLTDLDRELATDRVEVVLAVLRRPVVAGPV